MTSIIIDEIVPTKWRLRLRDAEGKTREVEYKTGTELRLDVRGEPAEAEPSKRAGKEPAKAKDVGKEPAKAKDARKPARASDKTPRVADKGPRAGTETKTAEHAEKPEAAEVKREPEPPKVRRRKPEPGPGPGALVWEETEDDGVPGIRATHERGAFKILHAGGDAFALFYEWNSGKYQSLSCGALEALKQAAGQWTEDGKLRAPHSNLGAEAAKVACAPKDDAATPPAPAANQPSPTSPAVDPEKDKALMQGFEASVQKLLAARKGTP